MAFVDAVFRIEGVMRHDWIFDVLSDLHAYAIQNNLPELAGKVAEAASIARRETAEDGGGGEEGGKGPQGGPPGAMN